MSGDRVEELVAAFLDRREVETELRAEDYAASFGPLRAELLAAIRRALDAETTLRDAGALAPAEIAGYRVVREIGRGGMGAVFEVERGGERRALKLLHASSVASPAATRRFLREAGALARVRHPNVVAIHDHGIERGEPFLVMELVAGRSLAGIGFVADARRAAAIVRDLALGVATLHEAGIVHRDIKPQNVILRPDGTPVLLDLGLAALADDDTLTASGALLGTPRYMAPEQARGEASDERSDVFALGLILYELVCRRPARREGSRERVLSDVARRDVPRPRGVERDLDRILRSALAWKRERRTPSARALASDLDRYLAGAPVLARPPGGIARAADAARREPRTAAIAALALALCASMAWMLRVQFRPGSGSDARAAAEHVDAALVAWLQGFDGAARAEIERAERAELGGEALEVAGALIRGDARRVPAHARPAADAWLSGDFDAAAARAAPGPMRDRVAPVLDVLRVESLRRAADGDAAIEAAIDARERLPSSAAVASVLAAALEDAGDLDRAIRAARGAVELRPRSGASHAQLARLLAASGATPDAVASALRAAEIFQSEGTVYDVELARLLAASPDVARVKAELERTVEKRPDHSLAWFALGWLRDGDHELALAAEAYARAADAEPRLVRARTNLAHLYAGAQRGSCKRCDAAYGSAPSMFAPERAIAELAAVLRADRGTSEWAMGRIVQTALDLAERAPAAGAPGRLLAEMEELERDPVLLPAARARVQEAASRMRGAVGESR